MNILITGATGFIGRHLIESLLNTPYRLIGVTRSPSRLIRLFGDKVLAVSLKEVHEYQIDIVINLAGAGLLDWPWTPSRIKEIENSRIEFTRQLNAQLEKQAKKPLLSIHANAIGYYGQEPHDHPLNEESPAGSDSNAQLCVDWEYAGSATPSDRTVFLRLGVVLGKNGGALGRLLPLFKLGLGGKIADGQQIMPWVSLEDVVHVIQHAINNPKIHGPINVVSSQIMTNKEFTFLLAQQLKRPSFFTIPEFMLNVIFGKGAQLLTRGVAISNQKIKDLGYIFKHDDFGIFLKDLLLGK